MSEPVMCYVCGEQATNFIVLADEPDTEYWYCDEHSPKVGGW